MNIFETVNETSEKITDAGEIYIKKSQEYYTLKVFQQLSASISLLTKVLILGGLLFVGLFFLAFAAAMLIGESLGNLALGYFIIAMAFLLVMGVIYLNRQYINNRVVRSLSSKFFNS